MLESFIRPTLQRGRRRRAIPASRRVNVARVIIHISVATQKNLNTPFLSMAIGDFSLFDLQFIRAGCVFTFIFELFLRFFQLEVPAQ